MAEELTKYVVSHRNFQDERFASRKTIYVNKDVPKKIREGEIEDWTGDNIDSLNPWYCELTAIYWIWRNDSESRYISLEHYRRVFLTSKSNWFSYRFLEDEEILRILRRKRIILPLLHHFEKDIETQYKEHHVEEDLRTMKETIHRLFPEYDEDFTSVLKSHDIVLFNMFVMKREDLDGYCRFAFPILDEVFRLKKDDITKRDGYQKRAIGFLSERLFNVWLRHNIGEKDIFHTPIAHLDQKPLIHYLKDRYFWMRRKDYDRKKSRL